MTNEVRKYYLKVDEDQFIRDCITFPFEDYVEYERVIATPVHGGWHKLIDGAIVEIEELNPDNIELKIKREIQEAIDAYTLELMMAGII